MANSLVGAYGDTLDRSAFAARARGYAGTVDVEDVGGRRGQDLFGGVTSSAAVGDAEVHGEAARHAVGVTGSYEPLPEITYSGQWLHNPGDRSGVLAPAMTFTFNDAMSLLGSVYVPYGRKPQRGVLRSEYGAAPLSGLLQLRIYF